MPELRWVSPRVTGRDSDAVVSASSLPASGLLSLPRFLLYTLRITGQLKRSQGVIAYSLRADLTKRRFWTMAVSSNEASLRAFVRAEPHLAAMRKLAPAVRNPRFVQWQAGVDASLPQWREAEARLAAVSHTKAGA
jgi:hypothetical protein